MFRRKFVWLVGAFLLLLPWAGAGQAQGTGYNPANGHTYMLVETSASLTWDQAQAAARGMGGHLATVTSAEEQAFIASTFPKVKQGRYWHGAYQTPPSPETDPSGDWHWVTGEPWAYTHWFPGEPNDDHGHEDWGMFWHEAMWNDCKGTCDSRGYVAEFEPRLRLAPPTQRHHVLIGPATLDATLTDGLGHGLPDQPVTLVIVSGPNAGRTFEAMTNANGVAHFEYVTQTAQPGNDTAQAEATIGEETYLSNEVTVAWWQ